MTLVSRIASWSALIVVGVSPASAQDTTTRVSVTADGAQATSSSGTPAISADGRFVAFHSVAALVPDDTNGLFDVYVYDRHTATIERVNLGPGEAQATGGFSLNPSISGDGRYIAFSSLATNLVAADTNGVSDVFVRDRQANTTRRVNMGATGGGGPGTVQANGASASVKISADGRFVVFHTEATNLSGLGVSDTNNARDVILVTLQTRVATRVSVTSAGVQAMGGQSYDAAISADGSIITFTSDATNLVSDDTNARSDVFVRDMQAGTTTRVSVGTAGAQGNSTSYGASVSADGRIVAFSTEASTFDPGGKGTFIHDRQTGVTSPVHQVSSAEPAIVPIAQAISGNGRYVCFAKYNIGTLYGDLFLFDRQTQTKPRINVAPNGDPGNQGGNTCAANHDGSLMAFDSDSTNLVPGDTNSESDVFVRSIPGNLPPTATMALDKTALTFGAVSSVGTFVSQTAAQSVRLTQSGNGTVTWSAASNQPWLQVSPVSGSGSATLSISVRSSSGLPASGTVSGTIVITLTNAANAVAPIAVSLTLLPQGTSLSPFGTVDTPADNRTGATGAIPFTGWALDDIEVMQVSICRAAVDGEPAPLDPNCGGAAEIFVGFAVFIDGARPDVAGAFPAHPLSTRAGWGFMVLTNMLPNQGNGTYTFRMRAFDREAHVVLLGTRTMTCANASATLPFGTLDTPFQGGVASGSSYVNFGWVLTPLPKTIPIDGSTIRVLVDGVDVGQADYNHARSDIQALFPGFNNTNGAVGFRILDTTTMSNGLHTISWTVSDDQGAVEGIGSRFFTVSNGVSAVTAASTSARSRVDVEDAPLERSPLPGRRGWNLDAPFNMFGAGSNGVTVIRGEEVSRIELQLGPGDHTAYLRTAAGLAPLPIGSRLDPTTNTFTWAPGVGFVGRYDFVFARSEAGTVVSRREVRIILGAKGPG